MVTIVKNDLSKFSNFKDEFEEFEKIVFCSPDNAIKIEQQQALNLFHTSAGEEVRYSSLKLMIEDWNKLYKQSTDPTSIFPSLKRGDLLRKRANIIAFWYVCRNHYFIPKILEIFKKTSTAGEKDILDILKKCDGLELQSAPVSCGISAPPFKPPPYISKKIAKKANFDTGIWLSPYNLHTIRLSGRKDKKALLTSFLEEKKRTFIRCSVIGPSGAGKTRLVAQWMYEKIYSDKNTQWDAGIVKSREATPWKEWQISRDTLIVIDYCFNYDGVIAAISEKAKKQSQYKVRLLLLDHVFPDKPYLDIGFRQVYLDIHDYNNRQDELYNEHGIIYLEPEEEKTTLLPDIIVSVAKLNGKKLQPNDYEVKQAIKALFRMGETDESRAAVRHPLFAALMGQAIANGRNCEQWTRQHLLDYYFDPPSRIPWSEAPGNAYAKTLGPWVGCYVCVATLQRGADIDRLSEFLPTKIKDDESRLPDSQSVAQCAGRIVSSDPEMSLKPFEPDILGENFLLKFLASFKGNMKVKDNNEVKGKKKVRHKFFAMLSADSLGKSETDIAVSFAEVMQRLLRNLANDDQKIPDVKKAWRSLEWFLQPDHFPENNAIRPAVAISRIEFISHRREVYWAIRAKQKSPFSDIKMADLLGDTKGQLLQAQAEAIIRYLDWMCEDKKLKPSRQKKSLHKLIEYERQRGDGWPSLVLAASSGCHHSADLLLVNDSFKINQGTADIGWTPLMAACKNAHEGLAMLFLDKGAAATKATNDDNWTALMLACQSGLETVAYRLIHLDAKVNDETTIAGWTPLMFACDNGYEAIAEKLISEGAYIDQATKDKGWTPLMYACKQGHEDIVKPLLREGADIDIKTKNKSLTALKFAQLGGHEGVVQLIVNEEKRRLAD